MASATAVWAAVIVVAFVLGPMRRAQRQKQRPFQRGRSCIGAYQLPWKRDVPSFPFGEKAAIMLSAGALSRADLFFRPRITKHSQVAGSARHGEAV
jgi:hypothetical protein